jgi:hypothetical protein
MAETQRYHDYDLEKGSAAAAADLDPWGRSNPGSPTVGQGVELPLPGHIETPGGWDIGLGRYAEDERRSEPGLTLSIAGSPTTVAPGEEVKLTAVLQNGPDSGSVPLVGKDAIVTFHFRYLAGHFDKQELYRTRVQLPDAPLVPGEKLDLTALSGWRNPTNGALGDPFHLRVDTKDWKAGCRLRATVRFVERREHTAQALQELEDLLRSREVIRIALK